MVQQGRSGGDQCITVIRWRPRERNDGLPTRLEQKNHELGTRLGKNQGSCAISAWLFPRPLILKIEKICTSHPAIASAGLICEPTLSPRNCVVIFRASDRRTNLERKPCQLARLALTWHQALFLMRFQQITQGELIPNQRIDPLRGFPLRCDVDFGHCGRL